MILLLRRTGSNLLELSGSKAPAPGRGPPSFRARTSSGPASSTDRLTGVVRPVS